MGLTEIIINKSEELAKQRIAQNKAREQSSKEWREESLIAANKRDEIFRNQVWGALEKAQDVHNRRFEPLRDILEKPLEGSDSSLVNLLINLRDKFSPGSPILVTDRYEQSYDDEHNTDNTYYRGLFMVNNDANGNTKGVLSVCAIAKESKKYFLRPSRTEYSLAINYKYGGTIKEAAKPTPFGPIIIAAKTSSGFEYITKTPPIVLAPKKSNVFEYITKTDEIININSDEQGNPKIDFASHSGTSPSLEDIERSEKDRIKLGKGLNVVEPIKERFIRAGSSIRQEQLS